MQDRNKKKVLLIQEGSWSISIPRDNGNKATLEDLEKLVYELRTPVDSVILKEGWSIKHI